MIIYKYTSYWKIYEGKSNVIILNNFYIQQYIGWLFNSF